MELLQYSPATPTVRPEPVLIVPAWIMKYYILDLSPHNSLIAYLVRQGHGVLHFLEESARRTASWAWTIISRSASAKRWTPSPPSCPTRAYAAGYCLGGTLLTIAASAMARDGDTRLASLSLLAAQTDFNEPGELALFIDESQVSLLEAQMARPAT